MAERQRADRLLVARGLFESRARAQAAIEAGLVTANGKPVRKASDEMPPTPRSRASPRIPGCRAAASSSPARWSTIRSRSRTMSASTSAPRPAASPRCCSNGASLVYAIDVGRDQLHPSLRGHPRIVSMEETDIRSLAGKRLDIRPMSWSSTSASSR